jgi:hypothetical protein
VNSGIFLTDGYEDMILEKLCGTVWQCSALHPRERNFLDDTGPEGEEDP